MIDVTEFGGFILVWEVIAKATGAPTWTRLTAEHSWKAVPVWVFLGWLLVHLIRALLSGRE